MDALRAGAVGLFDSGFVYFCSEACKARYTGSPPPARTAAGPTSAATERTGTRAAAPAAPTGGPAPTPATAATRTPVPTAEAAREPAGADEVQGDAPPAEEANAAADGPPGARMDIVGWLFLTVLAAIGVLAGMRLAAGSTGGIAGPGHADRWVGLAGIVVLAAATVLDLVRRRPRGTDHFCVGASCAAILVSGHLGFLPDGPTLVLGLLAVYASFSVVECRLVAQRPVLDTATDGPPPDATLEWGGPRGPLANGLRKAAFWIGILPVFAGIAAVTVACLGGLVPTWQPTVPMAAVAVALAFLPWSIRNGLRPLAALARNGENSDVRFLDPDSVERAARAQHLVLLYRGVVTQGKPRVTEFLNYSPEPDGAVLERIVAAERTAEGSPVADALLAHARERGVVAGSVARVARYVPSAGVRAASDRGEIWVGSRRMLLEEGISTAPVEEDARQLEQAGRAVLFVAFGRRVQALVGLSDPIRPGVPEAIDAAHAEGLETYLYTGESRPTAEHVARHLRVRHVRPELVDDERAGEVRHIREIGGAVLVLGDLRMPVEMIQEADIAAAVGVRDGDVFPGEIVTPSQEPHRVVSAVTAARRTVSGITGHLAVAGLLALLNAGVSALGFLSPPGTLALVGLIALLPFARKSRIIAPAEDRNP